MPSWMAWAMALAVCSARRAMVSPRAWRWVEFAGRTWESPSRDAAAAGVMRSPRQRPHVMAGWGLGAGGRSLVRCGPGLVAAPPRARLALGRLGGRGVGGPVRRGGRLGLRAVAAVALAVAGGGAVAGLARGPAGTRGRGRSGGPTGAVALGGGAGGDHEPARMILGLLDLAVVGQALQAVADRAAGAAQRLGDVAGRQLLARVLAQVGQHLLLQLARRQPLGATDGVDRRGRARLGLGAPGRARRGGRGLAVACAGSLAVAVGLPGALAGGGAVGAGSVGGLAAACGGQQRQGGPGGGRGALGGQDGGQDRDQQSEADRVVGGVRHFCPLSWGAAVLRARWYLRRPGAVKLCDLRFHRNFCRSGRPLGRCRGRIGWPGAWFARPRVRGRGVGVGPWGRRGAVVGLSGGVGAGRSGGGWGGGVGPWGRRGAVGSAWGRGVGVGPWGMPS